VRVGTWEGGKGWRRGAKNTGLIAKGIRGEHSSRTEKARATIRGKTLFIAREKVKKIVPGVGKKQIGGASRKRWPAASQLQQHVPHQKQKTITPPSSRVGPVPQLTGVPGPKENRGVLHPIKLILKKSEVGVRRQDPSKGRDGGKGKGGGRRKKGDAVCRIAPT